VFRGLDYVEPTVLKQGMVTTSENMRFDGGKATVRKGIEFKAGSSVTLTHYPGYDEVFAMGTVSDPDDSNVDYLLAACRTKAILWNRNAELGALLTEDGAYLTTEAGENMALNVTELAVPYYSAVIASGSWSTSTEKATSSSHSFQTGDAVEISTSGVLPTDIKAKTVYYVINTGTNDFQLATTLANARAGTTLPIGASAGSGNHTVQSVVTQAAITAVVASGSVSVGSDTFTETAHGFSNTDAVYVDSTDTLPTAGGNLLSTTTKYYISAAAANTFKLAEVSGGSALDITDAGSGTHVVRSAADTMKPSILQANDKVFIFRSGARPLEWDNTFAASAGVTTSKFVAKTNTATSGSACPDADWGIYFRNRLIVPTGDTLETTVADNPQTIVMSDILDDDEFVIDGEFYVNKGSADYIIGAIPYQEDQLLVFNRRSIHIISGIRNTSTAIHAEITRQYGCVARKSIAQAGPNTYFLSDNGIYALEPGFDPAKGDAIAISKVTSFTIPLSRPVNDQLAEVNFDKDVVEKAVAIVHDNKYFLALPVGADLSCTICLVYDFLLDAWVSKDTFPSGFTLDDFAIAAFGSGPGKRRLFVSNDKGWWLYEEAQTDDSTRIIGTDTTETTAIAGKLVTRSYNLSNVGVKKFHTGQIACDLNNGDVFTIIAHTADPDSSTDALTVTGDATEDKLTRFGIRSRGYSAKVEINVSAGRPTFKHVVVEGSSLVLGARSEDVA